MLKRICAFVLAFMLLFTSVPVEAVASMIGEDPAAEIIVQETEAVSLSGETTAQEEPALLTEPEVPETTEAETIPETTETETVPETTEGETVPETTEAETVPETTEGETVPETTEVETVPETTEAETVPETTEETVPETVEVVIGGELIVEETIPVADEAISALAVEEPTATGDWAADALAIAKAYYDANYTQETVDGNPYTVFGNRFSAATETDWNAYFVAYCIDKAFELNKGTETAQTFVPKPESAPAAEWVEDLKAAGLYQEKTGYTPKVGDLIVFTTWNNTPAKIGFVTKVESDWSPKLTFLTADDNNNGLDGKMGTLTENMAQNPMIGFVRIPSLEGLLEQSVTAKVYTSDTFEEVNNAVTATAEGNLPVNAEIRVYPVTPSADQINELEENGTVKNGYGVKLYVNGSEYTGTLEAPISVEITDSALETDAAMIPYALDESLTKLSGSLKDGTLTMDVNIPTEFALVEVSSITVTTAQELKTAVEMGVPEITLGDDITVDDEYDDITVKKGVEIDLDGHTLTNTGDDTLFRIVSGGELTMNDTGTIEADEVESSPIDRPTSMADAKTGSVEIKDGELVLSYYITDSSLESGNYNGATVETRHKYEVKADGRVENKSAQPLFTVDGGELTIVGGVYTGNLGSGDKGRAIVMQNDATANLSGGYLAGFEVPYSNGDNVSDQSKYGGAIYATDGAELNITGTVLAANAARAGGAVYAKNARITVDGGVISGNIATGNSDASIWEAGAGPHIGGGGFFLDENTAMTVESGYITNNKVMAEGYCDGGGAVFAKKGSVITIGEGGEEENVKSCYITSNVAGGGGGAIRTAYGWPEDTSAHEIKVYIRRGAYICSNYCKNAEGGGISINSRSAGWVTGGYINNNRTNTQRDWGGGGIFNANGSYLELRKVLITENEALGLGGGVAGCSTGDIHLAVDDGGAMFDNKAYHSNYSGDVENTGVGSKREDYPLATATSYNDLKAKLEAAYTKDGSISGDDRNAINSILEKVLALVGGEGNEEKEIFFDVEKTNDFFCVHLSKIEAQMLGRGSCDWEGTSDYQEVRPPQRKVIESEIIIGLTSTAMAPSKKEARYEARAYINGNYSNVHGGGIMCNGDLDVGTPVTGSLPAWLEIVGTKVFKGGKLTDEMFDFELMEILDENGNLVTTGTNDADGRIVFGQQLVFGTVGEFKYTIREIPGPDEEIEYDDKVYSLVVTTVLDAAEDVVIQSVTIDGKEIPDIEGDFYVSLPEDEIKFTNKSGKDLDLEVKKIWEDDGDRDAIRPESIEVELMIDNEPSGQKKTLNAQNNWTAAFEDLPATTEDGEEIRYSIAEITAPEGYKVSYKESDNDLSWEITNTHIPETVSISARKIWQDNDNQDGLRPDEVTLTLLADGQAYKDADNQEVTVTLTGSGNEWTSQAITGLPKYKNVDGEAVEIVYSFAEPALPEGYEAVVAGTTVTNTHEPEKTEVSFRKVWEDNNNHDGKRPQSITVKLLAGGEKIDSLTVTAEDDFSGAFKNLPKYKNGTEIEYTLEEEAVEGYTVDPQNNGNDWTITNSHEDETVDITARKIWEDNNDQDALRPRFIVLSLYADGAPCLDSSGNHRTVELRGEGNEWTAEIKDLPKYKNVDGVASEIQYTLVEQIVPTGYEKVEEGATITNTHIPETVSVSVTKTWADGDDQDGKRPESITLSLYADGGETPVETKTVTPDANGDWKCSFTNLPKYKNVDGQRAEIEYTVVETAVPEYNVDENGVAQDVTADVANGAATLTNTHIPAMTSLPFEKVWIDGEGTNRPESITVILYADEVETKTMTVTAEDEWKGEFTDLAVYKDGKEIKYTIAEAEVPEGYASSVSGNVITNSLKTQITVTKVWEDDDDHDGLRPEEITVYLYADGSKVKTQVVKPDEKGVWSHTFTDLPKYKLVDGEPEEIRYTVGEATVAHYETDVDGFEITNTHVPETTQIKVEKIWVDDEDNDRMRPDGIIVRLYADGDPRGEKVYLDESNDWKHTFRGTEADPMYVYNGNGEKIDYEVREIGYVSGENEFAGLPEGYQGKVQADNSGTNVMLINTRTSEKTSITVKKVWDDRNDSDGIRPSKIQVILMKNGKKADTATLSKKNGWTCTWKDLPMFADGEEVEYEVVEAAVNGYTAEYDYKTSRDGKTVQVTVTNSHTPAGKRLEIRKVWKDNDNKEGLRPKTIKVQLYKNGKAYGDAFTVSASGGWKKFVQVPVCENGDEIEWTIKEVGIPKHYSVSYDQKDLTITNRIQSKEVPKTGDENNLLMWIGLLGLCSAGAAAVLLLGRKRRGR